MRFELMFSETPFRWTDPTTWPWIVWAWLVILLAGGTKPVSRWVQRRKASGWPTTQGRIEVADVAPKKRSLIPTATLGRAPAYAAYVARLAYSYSVEGQFYSGHYDREFGSEEEGWEFVRDLKGKSVMVSYNPRHAAESSLSEDAVKSLLDVRSPLPDANAFQVPVSNVAGWVKPLLWPFIALSAIGLGVSLWVHFGAFVVRKVAPEPFFWMLQVGIFVVWFPAVFVAMKRVGNTRRKDFWKLVLRGTPEWMRFVVYGFFGYAVLNFLIFMPQAPKGGTGGDTPVIVWRGFSGHWMAFYSAALAILYSAAVSTTTGLEPPRQS